MILLSNQNNATFRKATPAMTDPMLPLPGLSPVAGKNVVVKFDGGRLSSDGGILTLREIEGRLRIAASRTRALATMSRTRWPTSSGFAC
jgi:hypothetical protein